MTEKNKILAAIDLSDFSAMTVHYAAWMAEKTGSELILINVINQRDLDMVRRAMIGYDTFSFPDYLDEQIKDRQLKMKELFEGIPPKGTNCRYLVKDGIPYYEILEAIKAEAPMLLILSTKGRSNLADVVVGSTARKLFRRCPIPLITIPSGYTQIP
ncbi:putative Universal stress protein family protein [Desulfosarcina cetonica]|uniref:universal stress protein n=1 Tax=Desulfosarcina cetonica TaxID=90730 RepID=UPI0006D291C8|nr:universal stress protein [Desulfosarcina cetonica]VTR64875.1 putative Universal stress protein family protein [Desulfosarcina cetonica]